MIKENHKKNKSVIKKIGFIACMKKINGENVLSVKIIEDCEKFYWSQVNRIKQIIINQRPEFKILFDQENIYFMDSLGKIEFIRKLQKGGEKEWIDSYPKMMAEKVIKLIDEVLIPKLVGKELEINNTNK